MNWTFPKICTKKTEVQQLAKIIEEVNEFNDEQDRIAKDLEAIDIYHAAETLLRIRFEDRTAELDARIRAVIDKNQVRGKYF